MTGKQIRDRMLHSVLAAITATCAFCGMAFAQVAQTDAPIVPRFEIVRFEAVGNTLLKAEEIDAAVVSYVGKEKDFSDIQRALESLETVYREHGYGVVQV